MIERPAPPAKMLIALPCVLPRRYPEHDWQTVIVCFLIPIMALLHHEHRSADPVLSAEKKGRPSERP